MYPTTPRLAETTGRTEEILGSWIGRNGRRSDIVLATKITGHGNHDVRNGAPIGPQTLRQALEGSLRRLQTDYVDLYQLHWPNRGSYHFRQWRKFDPSRQEAADRIRANMLATLETLSGFVKAGQIRAVGLSNETAWGTAQFLALAEAHGLPRVATIQNEYSLLCRHFDLDLAELSHHENVGLLAFSPLAAGLLSGKYIDGHVPAGSRMSIYPDLNGRNSPLSRSAIAEYAEVARRHGLNLAQMSLAFCRSRPFTTSVIIGATSLDQLATDLGAADLNLSPEVLGDIAEVQRRHPLPM
jgi:aryl-alcohol dehydrogenase-like predicted oxidoreductase